MFGVRCAAVQAVGEANREGAAREARMGDEDAVEALSGTGCFEDGVVEVLRCVSRRTIHEWIETGQLDRDVSSGGARYTARPPMGHKLDPYKRIIDARLKEYPKLSAKRLFDEIRAAGYPGGYSRVRDYVRGVWPGGGGGGGAFRDAGGTPRPGGLRDLHAAVGTAPRAGGGAEPLPAAVAVFLPSADHGSADGRTGKGLCAVRRGTGRVTGTGNKGWKNRCRVGFHCCPATPLLRRSRPVSSGIRFSRTCPDRCA